ncbi:MAG: hypothetical protein M9886_07875 [Candidatus Nanopelagicales bacterium]|nr:hypothetical protein [Candidatus Nanopelagicales bacterium]
MAVIVTDPDVALDGLCSRVDRLLGMDPAEWSLDQLQRAVQNVPTARVRIRGRWVGLLVHRSARWRQRVAPSY